VSKIDTTIIPFLSQEQRRALKEGADRRPGIIVNASREHIAAVLAGMNATPAEIEAMQQAAMAQLIARRTEAGFQPDLADAGAIYNDAQRDTKGGGGGGNGDGDDPPPFIIRPFEPKPPPPEAQNEPPDPGAPPIGEPVNKADILKDYQVIWDGDAVGDPSVPELVQGMLPRVGVALLSGQWGMFKTFTAIDLGFSVMTLTPFATREILRQGGVLLFAAEGQKYVNLRLQGVKQAKTPEDATVGIMPFAWVKSSPQLTEDNALDVLLALAKSVSRKLENKFKLPLALIIIDTVSSAANFKDANDGSENQRVMDKLNKLAEITQTLVLAVDHFGKDVSTGTRNSSNKEGAADAVLALIGDRTIGGVVSNMRLAIRKNRDGDVGEEFHFRKRTVELREGGGSIVIDWAETTLGTTKAPIGWPKALHTLKGALSEALLSSGFMACPFPDMAPVRVVKREIARREYMRRYPGERSGAKTAFSTHCKAAVASGLMQSRQIALSDGSLEDVFWALAPC
jgi:hypothetical protein